MLYFSIVVEGNIALSMYYMHMLSYNFNVSCIDINFESCEIVRFSTNMNGCMIREILVARRSHSSRRARIST
jgi:hypothetical protein